MNDLNVERLVDGAAYDEGKTFFCEAGTRMVLSADVGTTVYSICPKTGKTTGLLYAGLPAGSMMRVRVKADTIYKLVMAKKGLWFVHINQPSDSKLVPQGESLTVGIPEPQSLQEMIARYVHAAIKQQARMIVTGKP